MKTKLFTLSLIILTTVFISCKHVDCSSSKGAYEDGYGHGELGALSGTSSCSTYINSWNNLDVNSGQQITESDCFCEGYDDGYNKRPDKYESK